MVKFAIIKDMRVSEPAVRSGPIVRTSCTARKSTPVLNYSMKIPRNLRNFVLCAIININMRNEADAEMTPSASVMELLREEAHEMVRSARHMN